MAVIFALAQLSC